jgi:DNA-binding MarR family transcriptional regulator
MRADHQRDLRLLSEIETSEAVTQRGLSKRLDIALGLTNLYLKRLVKKGYVKVVNIQKNRIRYLITPQGIAEKSRLTYEYLQYSLQLYQRARAVLRARFYALAAQGRKRMVFYGVGEAAELAYLCAREIDLELVGVVDADHAGSRFLDHTVLDPTMLPKLEYDCVVITSFDDGEASRRRLEEMGIPGDAVVTLKV